MKSATSASSTRKAPHSLLASAPVALLLGAIAPLCAAPTTTTTPEKPVAMPSAKGAARAPLTEDQKALHVLNRLAFGPRAGDIESVRKLGVSQWIEQQLSPQKIDDSTVESKLRAFQTLAYPNQKLWLAYVSGKAMRNIKNDARKQAQAAAQGTVYKPKVVDAQKQRVLDVAEREGFSDQIDLQVVGEMQSAKLLRAVSSQRQLQEVLVDFWANHFNLDINKQQVQTLRLADERDVIRPHVLGKFRDMLGASAHSPAMMIYLDNARSTAERAGLNTAQMKRRQQNKLKNAKNQAKLARKQPETASGKQDAAAKPEKMADAMNAQMSAMPAAKVPVIAPRRRGGINENYARELMELHTLGVDGGYTQKDVQEVARCFTGWSVNQSGEFEFYAARHDNDEKIVLGQTIPANGGAQDGERVLDLLAKSPATARYISRKLVMRLVNDNPPATLIERAAQTFIKTDGDLREVTKTIVTSPEFFAPENYRVKIKSPLEFAVSSVRALDGQFIVADAEAPDERMMLVADGAALARANRGGKAQNKTLGRQIAQMGQPLYAFQAPTGYSENSANWVSSGALIARLNFALDLTNGRLDDVEIKRDDVFKGVSLEDHNAMIGRLVRTTLHSEITPATRQVVEKQLQPDAAFDAAKAGALLLGSPEFQRR